MKYHDVEIPGGPIAEFCKRHHIVKLSLFGSILRDDFTPESDVDVLVEFEAGYGAGYITLGRMEQELSAILHRRVDLRPPSELSRYFQAEVMREAQVQYDAT
ncbi:MAG: nucleotidyltransferase family protein [Chloroflexi bacterium]|nr:nucleotidyltransferase family protein [Chloroflexota bacterium]